MEDQCKSLKDMIDLFLRDSSKVIRAIKREKKSPNPDEFEEIAQRVWDLHHFSQELMEARPTESMYYNARIIKELTEERLGEIDASLIEAADAMKKEKNDSLMKSAVEKLAQEDKARNVLFENLEEISQELAA